MTKHFVRVAAMGIAGCIALSATADTFVWQGASGGSWNDQANWVGNVVPDASGAVADFSAASGTYTVSVASAVTVGKIVFAPSATASLTLSGEKITFAATDTPEVEMGASGTLYLQNNTGGTQGLRKTGTGIYRPSTKSSANCYSGRTYVDAGTVFLVKSASNGSFGGSMEVAAGATLKWDNNDELDTYFYPYANGGTLDMNGKLDYIGTITFSNGGLFTNGTVFIDNAAVAKITTSGDGLAGTFNGTLVASSLFMASNRGNIHVRTQEVNVVSADATLAMTGRMFDNRACTTTDPYKKEYRYDGSTPPANPPPYRGQLRKTGAGDLLLYNETVALSGPTTVADGRLILSNSVDMLRSTIKLSKGNSSLVVAPNATLRLSGIDSPDDSSLDFHGVPLDLGGLGDDALFAGTLVNCGTIRKLSSNSQTFMAAQTQRDWDVLGGTLHFGVPAPVVWYTFDDASNLGRDSGSAGKNLSVSNDAGVVWSDGGVTGGCASFKGDGCLMSETAVGLPGGNSAFTVALWIKPTNSNYALVTWGNENTSQWNGFVSSGNNKLKHAFWEGAANDFISDAISGSFTDGTWRHVAITYNPVTGTRTFYVNGAVLSSNVMPRERTVSLNKPFYLGVGMYSNNFKGKMDDVMVFDTALSQADIARLAGQRTGAAAPTAFTPAGGTIRLEADATISFRHAEESFASISGRGTLGLYDSVATIAPAANTTNEVGRLAGDGTLVKNGAGTLALSRLREAGGKLDVRAGTVTAKGPATGLKDHLLAWWTFDDPENPGADASGNGMTIRSVQSKYNDIDYDKWSWPNRFKTTGGAAYFEGNSTEARYLELADKETNEAKLPNGANPTFTVAMWINPDSDVHAHAGLFYWGAATAGAKVCVAMRFNGGTMLNPYFWGGGDYKWTFPADFKTGVVPDGWHHVAFAAGGEGHVRALYVDGVYVAGGNNSTALTVPASTFRLGYDVAQAKLYKGYMDDVMIFDKVLSADEIRAVMQGVALEEPMGGMAAATASGTSFAVTDGQVAFSGLAATGTVSVAAAAEALFTSGENVLAGALAGAGTLTVADGASLSLTGGQDFGGTLDVRAGGALALVPNADARVQTLQLAEGTTLAAQPAESAAPAIVSTDAVALPASAIVRVAVPESASGFSATLVESTAGLTGDVDGWTLDATLPTQGSWRAGVRKIGNKVVLSVYPSGTYILFR